MKVTENGGRWGFIDVSGKMVIPAKFSKEPYPFREGKASVAKREGGVVMIDKTGTVISPEFEVFATSIWDMPMHSSRTTIYGYCRREL